jgi:chromosome partitioning protein
MKIISICSEKGGAGKTTTTVGIAKSLVKLGFKVLTIDLDQQGNLGRSLGFIKDGKVTSAELLYNTISGMDTDIQDIIRHADNGIDYIPSSQMLTSITSLMANDADSNYIVRRALDNAVFKAYDFILIDCRTLLDLLVANAMNASDYVIIPVESGVYSFDGLEKMLNKVESIRNSTNPKLQMLGILLNKVQRTTVSMSIIDSVRESCPNITFQTVLPFCPAQSEDIAMGVDKDGKMTRAFGEVAEEIVTKVFGV